MSAALPVPLSPRAQEFLQGVFKPKYAVLQHAAQQTPLTILVWGPSTGDLSAACAQIRDALRQRGHTVFWRQAPQSSMPATRAPTDIELPHAHAVDLVVSVQASYSAVAEVHDFAEHRVISFKMLIFVDARATDGYAYRDAVMELKTLYDNVETYKYPDDVVPPTLLTRVIKKVSTLQMVKYRATANAPGWGLMGGMSVPSPLGYNLLELFRQHRDEIETLTDPTALFLLAFVNEMGRVPLDELAGDAGLSPAELRANMTRLGRGQLLREDAGNAVTTVLGKRLLEEIGFLGVPPAPLCEPAPPSQPPSAKRIRIHLAPRPLATPGWLWGAIAFLGTGALILSGVLVAIIIYLASQSLAPDNPPRITPPIHAPMPTPTPTVTRTPSADLFTMRGLVWFSRADFPSRNDGAPPRRLDRGVYPP